MSSTRLTSARAETTDALRRYAPGTFIAGVVLVHLLIAAQSVGPMYLFDEVGYLAAGSVIAGVDAHWALCGSSYAVGYSALLAPLWWLPLEPVAIYQVAAFMSASIGAAVMWPATKFARMLGATRWAALGIGALVTLVPARALLDNYVIAENALTFLLAWTAVVALRVVRCGGLADHVWFGALLGMSAAVHTRALPIAAVGVTWLALRWWRRASAPVPASVGIGLAGGLAAIGFFAQQAMGAALFSDDSRIDDLLGSVSLGGIGTVILGQVFTQVVSWSLLTVLGGVVVVTHARTSIARRGLDGLTSPWWWLLAGVGAQAAFFVAVLAASADLDNRLDIAVFGRYLDPFVVPVAVVGAVALWHRTGPRATRGALVLALASVALYCAIILPWIPVDARWIPFAVPGLEPFLGPEIGDDRPYLALAALAATLGCVLLFRFRAHPKRSLVAALVAATAITGATDWLRVDPFEANVRTRSTILTFVRELDGETVGLAADLLPCAARNKLEFELAGRAVSATVDPGFTTDYVVGPADWAVAEHLGYVRVPLTVWQATAVWAAPGTS
ncbi:hypothetical protein [Demequina rhizosphaerae]|uniref:hypothetical protein n=1 Tax=Demequina rhizosphaerae TaxID=1638985 RepID=UPI0012E0590D|nr:hypothetical protein [Demequina rhizosphaerae]